MTVEPRCFGVLGDPVAHSRSPVMHQAAFDTLGLPHRYLPFHVSPKHLGAALEGLRALGFGGVNVTIPHKKAVASYVDQLDPTAARLGAANTIAVRRGRLVAHNTDGVGFLAALAQLGLDPIQHAVVFGSGGASRAVVDALGSSFPGVVIHWISRDPNRVEAWPGVTPGTYEDLSALPGAVDLWVNGTPVGMQGGPHAFPVRLPLERSSPGARVVDLVYPASVRGLWGAASQRGMLVQDGLPMLVAQGAASLEIWLGHEIPQTVVAAMHRAVSGSTF